MAILGRLKNWFEGILVKLGVMEDPVHERWEMYWDTQEKIENGSLEPCHKQFELLNGSKWTPGHGADGSCPKALYYINDGHDVVPVLDYTP